MYSLSGILLTCHLFYHSVSIIQLHCNVILVLFSCQVFVKIICISCADTYFYELIIKWENFLWNIAILKTEVFIDLTDTATLPYYFCVGGAFEFEYVLDREFQSRILSVMPVNAYKDFI